MDEFERDFSNVEAIVVDGQFADMLKDVDDARKILEEGELGDDEAQELLNLLNSQWKSGNYYAKKMEVTGDLYIRGTYPSMIYDHLESGSRTTLSQYPFRSSSFSIYTEMVEVDEGFTLKRQLLLSGRILLETDEDDEDDIDGMTDYACAVIITPETRLDFPSYSLEQAHAWLEAYSPNLKQEIDARLINADDEAEATMALRDATYNFSELTQEERSDTILYLQTYLFHSLKYDQIVPYLCELHGNLIGFDEETEQDTQLVVNNIQKGLLVPLDILCDIDDETDELLLGVTARLVVDKTHQKLVQIPLSTLQYMKSGREIYEEYLG